MTNSHHQLCILLLFLLASAISSQLVWKRLNSGSSSSDPTARRDAGIGYDDMNNQVVLFGGRGARGSAEVVYGDTWLYDLKSATWTKVTSDGPPPRFSFVSGVSGGFFYVATGEGPNKIFYSDIWRFHLSSQTWEELLPQPVPDYYTNHQWQIESDQQVKPSPRYGAAGGVFNNGSNFYLFAGFGTERAGDTLSYSLPDKGWFEVHPDVGSYTPVFPHARCLHAGTMISHDQLLIFGGCLTGGGTGGPCPSGDVWMYDGKTGVWHQKSSCPSPRTYASMALLPISNGERRVVLYGGQAHSKQVITTVEWFAEEVAVYNPDMDKWILHRADGDVPTKRISVAMATGATGVYMYGGYDLQEEINSGELFILKGDSATSAMAPQLAMCKPTFFNLIMLHGILMALAFGFFFPWGAFVARYLRHKDPLWFHLHRLFQVFGLLLGIGGLVCGCLSVQFDHFKFVHAVVGIVAMILAVLQPLNALIRPKVPGLNEPKSTRRVVWEFIHGFFGRCAIALGLVNISLGVFLAISHFLIWVLWFAYLGFVLLVNLVAEVVLSYQRKKEVNVARRIAVGNKYVVNPVSATSSPGHDNKGFDSSVLETSLPNGDK